MSIFLAVIAFLMAFGALWFTSEIARRMDIKSQSALQPHVGPLQESLRRAERQIRDLTLGLEAAERQIHAISVCSHTLQPGFSFQDQEDRGTTNNVTTLDILRGAQRFYPSDTYKS